MQKNEKNTQYWKISALKIQKKVYISPLSILFFTLPFAMITIIYFEHYFIFTQKIWSYLWLQC